MAEVKKDFKKRIQEVTFKALKATIKGVLLYGVYFVLSMFLASISEMVPGFQQIIETFIMIYIILTTFAELTSETIFQHFFDMAKALFVILYLVFSLKSGVMGITFQNVNLIIDLRSFLVAAMLLSLLGLAKSMFQAIDFLNAKTDALHV
jgi:hypothetical protein